MDSAANNLPRPLPTQAELTHQILQLFENTPTGILLDIPTIEKLIRAGADVNAKNADGESLLLMACSRGDAATVTALLTFQGILVNEPCHSGDTPLSYAVFRRDPAILRALLIAPDLLVNSIDRKGETALMTVASRGRPAHIMALLSVPGIQVNLYNRDGYTALMMAKDSATVKALLTANDINVNLKSRTLGNTALILACGEGETSIVSSLLATPGIDVNLTSSKGDTALMRAANNGHYEVVEMLIAKGANISEQNYRLETTLNMTVDCGHREVTYRLLSAMDLQKLELINPSPRLYWEARLFKAKILAIQTDIYHTLRAFHLTSPFASLEGPIKLVFDFDKESKPKWYHHRMESDINAMIEKLNNRLKEKEAKAERERQVAEAVATVSAMPVTEILANPPAAAVSQQRRPAAVVFSCDTRSVKRSKTDASIETNAPNAPSEVAQATTRRNPKRSHSFMGSYTK